MAITGLRKLCTPAYVYLVISAIFLIVSIFQNYGNVNTYCIGSFTCDVSSTFLVLLAQVIYILFWTWVLNLICGAGAPWLSWLLVLLPFILFFILLLALFVL